MVPAVMSTLQDRSITSRRFNIDYGVALTNDRILLFHYCHEVFIFRYRENHSGRIAWPYATETGIAAVPARLTSGAVDRPVWKIYLADLENGARCVSGAVGHH